MPRPYALTDPSPHGTRNLTRYELRDQPQTSNGKTTRRYGRRRLARTIQDCERCIRVDARDARLSRIHTAYRRRNR